MSDPLSYRRDHGPGYIAAPAANDSLDDEHDDTRMDRLQTAAFLRFRGYPISDTYFKKLCNRGLGPRVDVIFGGRHLHMKRDVIAWAEARCVKPSPKVAA